MSGIRFLKNFVRNPITVGAVWPSSPWLSKVMVSEVGLEKASAAVELGPGTGVVTPFILKSLPDNAKFFAVELNPELYECFKRNLPDVKVYNEDAAKLKDLLRRERISHIDTVISGLPWASFPFKLQDILLDVVLDVLPKGGHFTTFAYLQGLLLPQGIRFRKKLKQRFSKVGRSSVEWRNLPPAFCYRCVK